MRSSLSKAVFKETGLPAHFTILTLLFLFLIGVPGAAAQTPSWVPTNGLQAYFPLDGNLNDVSGKGYNGSAAGTVPFTTDRKGQAGKAMQGGNGYVPTSNQFFRFSRTSQFTVSVWFTVPSSSCPGRLISTESPEGHLRIAYAGNGQIVVQFGDYLYPAPVTVNVWHHLVYVYDNRNESVYIDGQLKLTNYEQEMSEVLVYNTPFTIGAKAASAYDRWCGNIDEVGVWNRPLSAGEVTQLFTETPPALPSWIPQTGLRAYFPLDGNLNDISGNGFNGTAAGTIPYVTDRKGQAGKAMQGGNGYVPTSNQFFRFSRTSQFTVSVWFTV
ncbi:MAG: LamG domain-containing protein, partial [Bacteroidota bacterium]